MTGGKAKSTIAAATRKYQAVERDQVDPHARRAALEHSDDQLHRGGNGGDLDEREAEEPDVRADPRLIGGRQRRVHEPAAARGGIEEDRAAEEDPAQHEAPEAVGRQAREGQVARAQHLRQDHDREGLEDRHGEEKHHDRAVQREDLVVAVGGEEVVAGNGELDAHQQRQHAAKEEKATGAPPCTRGRLPSC